MKITISNINGILPTGQVDIIVHDGYAVPEGLNEELFLTDQKYQLTTDYNVAAKEQRIQALVYDKYKLQFVTKELYHIDLMKYGDVLIEFDNGFSIHKANVIDISRTRISGDFWSVEVFYYDVNSNNYPGGVAPVVQYLESDFVQKSVAFDQSVLLRVYDSSDTIQPYSAYSALQPKLTTGEVEGDTFTNQGVTVMTNGVLRQYVDAIFYMKEGLKQKVLSLLPLVGNHKVKAFVSSPTNPIVQLVETPQIEVTDMNASDLWQVKVRSAYSIVNHYEYSKP